MKLICTQFVRICTGNTALLDLRLDCERNTARPNEEELNETLRKNSEKNRTAYSCRDRIGAVGSGGLYELERRQ